MKKIILFLVFSFLSLYTTCTVSLAQTSNSAASTSSEIVNLLSSNLNLSQTQVPQVQNLVSQYAGKFSTANANVANSGGGMKAKLEKDAQTALAKEFSTELPKLLNSTQTAQYSGIKDKVTSLFTQIK